MSNHTSLFYCDFNLVIYKNDASHQIRLFEKQFLKLFKIIVEYKTPIIL